MQYILDKLGISFELGQTFATPKSESQKKAEELEKYAQLELKPKMKHSQIVIIDHSR